MLKRKKHSLMDSAAEAAENIRPTIESAMDTAREKAVPLIHDARERATPLLQDGRDLAVEKASEAREKAGPLLHEGKELAAEKAAQGREYAAEKAPVVKAAAREKVNELRGIEPEPEKKGGKLKKVLFLGVLAGLGAILYKKLAGDNNSQANWQSSYVPAPAPAASSTAAAEDDQAAAAPGEAIADSTDKPKSDTTPDDPAEVVNLDDSR